MNNQFLKNLSYLTLIQISNAFIPLLIIPYISRIIGVENFSSLEFTRIYCYYFTIFINYGFDLTITRYISINRENRFKVNRMVNQTIYAKVFLFLISTIFFLASLEFYEALESVKLLLILTFLINVGYVFYPIWFFQGVEKMAKISIINFISKCLIALLTILLITSEEDYWLYNFFQSLGMIGIAIYSLYILKIKFSCYWEKPQLVVIKKILVEGFPIFFGTILVTVITSLYFIFLKSYSNTEELAKFSTSNKLIATLQLLILLPFSQAFFPLINKKLNEGRSIFKKYIKIASLGIILVAGAQGMVVYFFPELIIKIVFGKDFLIATESVKILAFLPLFACLTNVYGYQGLLSLKKDKLFLYIHILFAVVCVVSNFIFINNYDTSTASYIRIGMEIAMALTCFLLYLYFVKDGKSN